MDRVPKLRVVVSWSRFGGVSFANTVFKGYELVVPWIVFALRDVIDQVEISVVVVVVVS